VGDGGRGWVLNKGGCACFVVDLVEDDVDDLVEVVFGSVEGRAGKEVEVGFGPVGEFGEAGSESRVTGFDRI